jgi:hypothetical protein
LNNNNVLQSGSFKNKKIEIKKVKEECYSTEEIDNLIVEFKENEQKIKID